jgi:hypothetical protein
MESLLLTEQTRLSGIGQSIAPLPPLVDPPLTRLVSITAKTKKSETLISKQESHFFVYN